MHHCAFLLIKAEKRQAFRTTFLLNISHLPVFKKSDWVIQGRWREQGAKAD